MEKFSFIAKNTEIWIITTREINTKINVEARRVKDAAINEFQTFETATDRTSATIKPCQIELKSTESGGIKASTSIKPDKTKINVNKTEIDQVVAIRRGDIQTWKNKNLAIANINFEHRKIKAKTVLIGRTRKINTFKRRNANERKVGNVEKLRETKIREVERYGGTNLDEEKIGDVEQSGKKIRGESIKRYHWLGFHIRKIIQIRAKCLI
jgi:hypothetical protein